MEEGEDRISSLEKDIEKLTKEKEELSVYTYESTFSNLCK